MRLPWLVIKKKSPLYYIKDPGAHILQHMGIFTILGVWLFKTYHHTKPESHGYLDCQEKAGPSYPIIGPWGPYTSIYGAYLPLWMSG